MKALTILIFGTVLCGLCDCQGGPAVTEPPDNTISVEGQLSFPTPQTVFDQLWSLVPQSLLSSIQLPGNITRNALETVIDQMQDIQSNGKSIFESFVARLRALLADIVKRVQNIYQLFPRASVDVSLNRRRRSLLTAPLNAVEELFSTAAGTLQNGVQESIAEMFRLLGSFIMSTALPWTHRFLDDLAATQRLPVPVNTLIQNFNMVYELLRLMGFVKA